MIEDDRTRFARQMTVLSVTFDREISDELGEIYFRAGADFSIAQFERAVALAVAECRFFPKPVELREMIEGTAGDRAAAAWEIALNACRRAGYFKSVLFIDGFIGQALATVFGGWLEFCDAMHPVYRAADDVSFEDREAARLERRVPESRLIQIGGLSAEMIASRCKQFSAAYRAAEREQKAKPYLPGHHEIENRNTVGSWSRGGFQIEAGREVYRLPVFIAEREQNAVATFDRLTGYMTHDPQQLLEQEPGRSALPPAPPRALLSACNAMSEDELQAARVDFNAGLAKLADQTKLPEPRQMTAAETLARIQELKAQAEIFQ